MVRHIHVSQAVHVCVHVAAFMHASAASPAAAIALQSTRVQQQSDEVGEGRLKLTVV